MAFFRRRGDRKAKSFDGALVEVHLNARLQPMHRGRLFEDPVIEALRAQGMRAVVYDAGTLMTHDRIESCDVAFAVPRERADEGLEIIRQALVRLGAPRGSTITMYGDELDPVGTTQGVVLRLGTIDTVDFTDDENVEHNWALDALIGRMNAALGDEGSVWSWRVQDGSDVFVYGPSRLRLRELLAPQLAVDPLLRDAEIIDFA
ncbi:MAG: hypothetical protein JWP75_3692 [Frondihabitans sp.]|nr:hypothetical protein [Frondihabitans sp.]